jgi:hypothetical protein
MAFENNISGLPGINLAAAFHVFLSKFSIRVIFLERDPH